MLEAIQNVVHRIYMLEIPSRDVDMKPFSMILQASPQFSSTKLLNAAKLSIKTRHFSGHLYFDARFLSSSITPGLRAASHH